MMQLTAKQIKLLVKTHERSRPLRVIGPIFPIAALNDPRSPEDRKDVAVCHVKKSTVGQPGFPGALYVVIAERGKNRVRRIALVPDNYVLRGANIEERGGREYLRIISPNTWNPESYRLKVLRVSLPDCSSVEEDIANV